MTVDLKTLTPRQRIALIEEVTEWIEWVKAAKPCDELPVLEKKRFEGFIKTHPFLYARLWGHEVSRQSTLTALVDFKAVIVQL